MLPMCLVKSIPWVDGSKPRQDDARDGGVHFGRPPQLLARAIHAVAAAPVAKQSRGEFGIDQMSAAPVGPLRGSGTRTGVRRRQARWRHTCVQDTWPSRLGDEESVAARATDEGEGWHAGPGIAVSLGNGSVEDVGFLPFIARVANWTCSCARSRRACASAARRSQRRAIGRPGGAGRFGRRVRRARVSR